MANVFLVPCDPGNYDRTVFISRSQWVSRAPRSAPKYDWSSFLGRTRSL